MSEPTSSYFEEPPLHLVEDVSVPLFKDGILPFPDLPDLPSLKFAPLPFSEDQALLRCIAGHIHNKRQLLDLCVVSRALHLAFTPALYREMDIVTSSFGDGRNVFEALPKNPHIRHVRRLQLDLNHGGPVNSVVRSLVRRMPKLEEFEWDGGILLQETQMTILLSCPRLKSFVMVYEPAEVEESVRGSTYGPSRNRPFRNYGGNRSDSGYSRDGEGHADLVQSALASADMHHLVPFSGLTKLKIGEMYDLKSRLKHDWKADILRILLASPDLKELTLGFNDVCVTSLVNDFTPLLAPFLRSLCEEYHAKGGKPLKLRALGLGLGVLLESTSYLSKLVDLEHLQELYVDNRGKIGRWGHCEPDSRLEGDTKIAWDTFTQDSTPNLRQVKLASDVVDFKQLGGYLASLIASPIRTRIQNTQIRKRSGLSQVTLKLWDTSKEPLDYFAFTEDGVDGLFKVLANSVAPQANASTVGGLDPIWQAFFGLAASSSRLVVYTKRSRGHDGIMHLGKLEAGLRTLPHVRDLVIACPLEFGGLTMLRFPKLCYLSGEVTVEEDLRRCFMSGRWRGAVASRLARAGKGLRTVKFGCVAWRVVRGGGDDGSEVTRLLSMDKYEQRRHGCDMGPASAFPEFAASGFEATFEARLCCDFVVRMW